MVAIGLSMVFSAILLERYFSKLKRDRVWQDAMVVLLWFPGIVLAWIGLFAWLWRNLP